MALAAFVTVDPADPNRHIAVSADELRDLADDLTSFGFAKYRCEDGTYLYLHDADGALALQPPLDTAAAARLLTDFADTYRNVEFHPDYLPESGARPACLALSGDDGAQLTATLDAIFNDPADPVHRYLRTAHLEEHRYDRGDDYVYWPDLVADTATAAAAR